MNTQTENPTATNNLPAAKQTPIPRIPRPHPASKISRLPTEAREFINQSLADNIGYSKIISQLEQMGHHGINGPNISKWARSGYRIWLDSRQELEIIRTQSEANIHLLRELGATNSASFHQLNDLFMATQLAKLMKAFSIENLQQQLQSDPMHFFRLSRSVSAHTRNAYRQQKLQGEIAKKQKAQPSQFRPTTSAAGYAVIAADLGLPPRFNTPNPVPSQISSVKSEIAADLNFEPAKTTTITPTI